MERRFFLKFVSCFPLLFINSCQRKVISSPPICPPDFSGDKSSEIFSPPQSSALRAACTRLIPTDDDPGAQETNVAVYIESQLAQPHFIKLRHEIIAGMDYLNQEANRLGASHFADLSTSNQDLLLSKFQQGLTRVRKFNSQHFFSSLLVLALEGFLGDPIYGGNTNEQGWRLLGFNPQPPRPRCTFSGG